MRDEMCVRENERGYRQCKEKGMTEKRVGAIGEGGNNKCLTVIYVKHAQEIKQKTAK